MASGIVLLVLIVLVLGGAGTLALLHFRSAGPARAARQWPVAPGLMIATRVDDPVPGVSSGWRPLVHYRYRVGEQDYEGVQLRPGPAPATASSREAAYAMIAPFAPGAQVPVRYNPYRPEESVLDVRSGPPLLLIGAGGLAAVGLLLAVVVAGGMFDPFDSPTTYSSSSSSTPTVSIDAPGASAGSSTMSNGVGGGYMTGSAPAADMNTTGFLIGRWTRTGDCSRTVSFNADGTFVTPEGQSGTWTASGAMGTYPVTMTLGGETRRATTISQGANAMQLIPTDGSPSIMLTRC